VQWEAGDLFARLDVDKRCESLSVARAEFVGFLGLEIGCAVLQVSSVGSRGGERRTRLLRPWLSPLFCEVQVLGDGVRVLLLDARWCMSVDW
jgi:hypothetical protein